MVFEPTELEKAYLAGFFDGEGWVGIYMHRQKTTVSPELRVAIAQKDTVILHWLRDRYHGSIAVSNVTGIHTWQATTHLAYKFLTDIRPYLRFKADRVDDCIAQWLPRSRKDPQTMKHYNNMPERGV